MKNLHVSFSNSPFVTSLNKEIRLSTKVYKDIVPYNKIKRKYRIFIKCKFKKGNEQYWIFYFNCFAF